MNTNAHVWSGVRTLRALGALGAAVAVAWPLAVPAAAQEATVSTVSEAWFQLAGDGSQALPDEVCEVLAPVCAAQPPAAPPPNPYPPGTFHVGVNAGQEEAQAFLTLDDAGVPAGAELEGGTLTIPLAPADAGTRAPDAAQLQACLVTVPVTQAEAAAAADRPPYDCATAGTVTVEVPAPPQPGEEPAPDAEGPRLMVDLDPLAAAWTGTPSLALVATEETLAAGGTWHLAFSGHEPYGAGAEPPAARLRYAEAGPSPSPSPSPATSSGSGTGSQTGSGAGAGSSGGSGASAGSGGATVRPPAPPPAPRPPAVPGSATASVPSAATAGAAASPPLAGAADTAATTAAPPLVAGPAAVPAVAAPLAVAQAAGPRYPLVYALPLIAVLLAGTAGTSLTAPMRVLRKPDPTPPSQET